MKKVLIILIIFLFDRITKIYLLNLQESGAEVDFYIFTFFKYYSRLEYGHWVWVGINGCKYLLSYFIGDNTSNQRYSCRYSF